MSTLRLLDRSRAAACVLGAAALTACAAPRAAFVPLGTDHPAHPRADAGWIAQPGAGLSASDAAALPSAEGASGGHEHGAAVAPEPGAAGDPAARYACLMHPAVTSASPGQCSICGMALEERAHRAPRGGGLDAR
jgi:hypothetical protein